MNPVDLALAALGKERTLTGRSVLWEFALRMIEVRPWLGNGFDAFWNVGDGSTSSYLQYVIRAEVKNFHNSYLDIAVQLGAFGLALAPGFLLLFAWRARALLRFDAAPLATRPACSLAFAMPYQPIPHALYPHHSPIHTLP